MKQIGLIVNPDVEAAWPLAEKIAKWLREKGIEFWTTSSRDGAVPEAISRSDLIVVLGGDGTTLYVARQAAPHDVPLFGVNLGRVGFLSEASEGNWPERLGKVIQGKYWLEKRLMLRAEVFRKDKSLANLVALNDIVVSRGELVRVVRFHLYVDDDHVTSYTADGLITATPTGSTAYSMAVGGPLLPPQLQNFLVLPVAPHLSFERPLVLHQNAIIKIQVEMNHVALVTADGRDSVRLENDDNVVIRKNEHESIFARIDGPDYFYNRLMQRLSYWSRKQE